MKKKLAITIIAGIFLVGIFNIYKPLPDGLSTEGNIFNVPNDSVIFLSDLTYLNSDNERVSDQEIFDEVFLMIEKAENFILIDMFLFNDFKGKEGDSYRKLSSELTQKLIDKKNEKPKINIIFITDPFNQVYGGVESEQLSRLTSAGIDVVETNLYKLRDSNPIYSSVWRSVLQFLPVDFIKLPNPFVEEGPKVGLKKYFSLLNFKANHRKVIVADYTSVDSEGNQMLKMSSLVTSANPHDGSSAHSNVAVKINDYIWRDILESEFAVINFSGDIDMTLNYDLYKDSDGDVKVQLLTEKKIKKSIVDSIDQTNSGDYIKLLMFYFSDREIVKSIKKAHARGVDVEIVLDPNKDAFGREKNGVPNVAVAREFKKLDSDFKLRWCNTNGEQCHSKILIVGRGDTEEMFVGSANFTKRNIHDYNLETNVKVSGNSVQAIQQAKKYFDKIWNNKDANYSLDYQEHEDESWLKYIQYRIMEKTGMSSF